MADKKNGVEMGRFSALAIKFADFLAVDGPAWADTYRVSEAAFSVARRRLSSMGFGSAMQPVLRPVSPGASGAADALIESVMSLGGSR